MAVFQVCVRINCRETNTPRAVQCYMATCSDAAIANPEPAMELPILSEPNDAAVTNLAENTIIINPV